MRTNSESKKKIPFWLDGNELHFRERKNQTHIIECSATDLNDIW